MVKLLSKINVPDFDCSNVELKKVKPLYGLLNTKDEKKKKDTDNKPETKTDPKKSKKGKKDSKVVDADFEDVTEKKNPKDDNKEKSA